MTATDLPVPAPVAPLEPPVVVPIDVPVDVPVDIEVPVDPPAAAPAPETGESEPVVRPGLFQLLRYSLGGRLHARHSSWVLHDVTCRSWLLRHFARTLLIVVPLLAVYLVLMPASLPIRLLTGLTFAGGIVMFSLVNTLVDTDRRAVRAGYLPGLPAQIRTQKSVEAQRLASRERRERIAERQARRRGV